jgi:elongation factor G
MSLAIEPKKSADRDRLAEALAKMVRDDPTFRAVTDEQTGQVVISGMGELHLEVMCNRLVNDFKVGIHVGKPRVAYRQTIGAAREVEARHIKQTGGAGQFAVIRVRLSPDPSTERLEFVNSVRGGAVPTEYIPAVAQGLVAAAAGGGSHGFPFVKLRAELLDGQSHEVDSSAMAFEAAGALAFRLATADNAVLLEPIMRIEVVAPEEYTGDVIGDLSSRRGAVEEMVTKPDGSSAVRARVPLAEMFQYSTDLRSVTQGRGHYTMDLLGYDEVPPTIATKLLEGR